MARLLLVAGSALMLVGCMGGSVSAFRLQHDADSVSSISTDGALLAHGVFKGETTNAYARVHAAELDREAGELADVLRSAHAGPEYRAKTAHLVRLARRASKLLDRLEHASSDRRLAGRLSSELADISSAAEAIGKSV